MSKRNDARNMFWIRRSDQFDGQFSQLFEAMQNQGSCCSIDFFNSDGLDVLQPSADRINGWVVRHAHCKACCAWFTFSFGKAVSAKGLFKIEPTTCGNSKRIVFSRRYSN